MRGYAGKILKVNLSNQSFKTEFIPSEWPRKFLGGMGFASIILFKETIKSLDAFGADNKLIVAPGLLTGIGIPTASKTLFIAESPLTGGFGKARVQFKRLKEYRKKRKFEKTSEPIGGEKMSEGNIYVIQKHDATHLHYDLRLEMDGVLKSWAVPKIPPTESGIKRLAVEVEDHPLEYGSFEGTIPDGEYGAGRVEIWDKGSYTLLEKKESKIAVDIHGEKLKGVYFLIRFKDRKNWLFLKKK